MDSNPFKPTIGVELLSEEEDLAIFIADIKNVNSISWIYNPPLIRAINNLISVLFKKRTIPISYKKHVDSVKSYALHVLLPTTIKIQKIG